MIDIEVDYNLLRDVLHKILLQTKFSSSKDQLADIFMKPLSLTQFQGCPRNLNLLYVRGHC
jgi:hypothetical protein